MCGTHELQGKTEMYQRPPAEVYNSLELQYGVRKWGKVCSKRLEEPAAPHRTTAPPAVAPAQAEGQGSAVALLEETAYTCVRNWTADPLLPNASSCISMCVGDLVGWPTIWAALVHSYG